MNHRRRMWALTFLLFVLAGCGSRIDPAGEAVSDPTSGRNEAALADGGDDHDGRAPSGTSDDAASAGSPATAPASSVSDAFDPRDPAAGPPTDGGEGAESPTTPAPGTVEGIVTAVDPSCVAPGAAMAITIETAAFADVTHAVTFADGDHHGAYGLGQADAEGRYVWSVVVPPAAGEGTATAIAAAGGPDGGGSGKAWFEVQSGECR